MLAPKVKLSFFWEEGEEQVRIEIPEVDQDRWKFTNASAEQEVLGLASRLVMSYLKTISSSVKKDREWLEDALNVLLERAADKKALIPSEEN